MAVEMSGSASLTTFAGHKAVVAAMVKDVASNTASLRIVEVLAVGADAAKPRGGKGATGEGQRQDLRIAANAPKHMRDCPV